MQAATPPDPKDKQAWRRWFRQRLGEASAPAAADVRRHLAAFLDGLPPSRIAAFAAMPCEIDLRPLVEDSRHLWHFPRIDGATLSFHPVRRLADLVPDAFGIDSPAPSLPAAAIASLDLFLVPGLGFGRDGSRLGRGKGFYDRALAHARPGIPILGVAFDTQVVDAVPVDAHDLPVTHLLTPRGLSEVRG